MTPFPKDAFRVRADWVQVFARHRAENGPAGAASLSAKRPQKAVRSVHHFDTQKAKQNEH